MLYDYISPNFEKIDADPHFPTMCEGSARSIAFETVIRPDPHKWYYDGKHPPTGFVNRDEAHILYNTALRFRGKAALEIGCASGFSAWHLAAGGVKLSVCDPIFRDSHRYKKIKALLPSCTLHGGGSPNGVEDLARQCDPLSLVFIDGDHNQPRPMIDAIVAQHYCNKDAVILFHDGLDAAVCNAVQILKIVGWKARVYKTSRAMIAAWRGDAEPVDHIPDPAIADLPIPTWLAEL